MKKFNFILFAGALLSLAAYQLNSAEPDQAQKAASVVSEEIAAAKKQSKDAATIEKTEAAAPAAASAVASSEKKADAQKAVPATTAPKK